MTNKHKCMISGCENSVSAKELIKQWRERAEELLGPGFSNDVLHTVETLQDCADELEASLTTTGERQ